MIDILKNTLEIIGKISNSSAGFLLKSNSGRIETIYSFGECCGLFDNIQESIAKLKKSGELSQEKLFKIPEVEKTAGINSWNSAYLKELQLGNQEIFYIIILFSKVIDNYNEANVAQYISLVDNFRNIINEGNSNITESEKETLTGGSASLNGKQIMQSLFEASEDLVFILNKDGYIKNVNEYGAACIDYETSEISGLHFVELVASKNKQVLAESFRKIIEDDKLVTFEAILMSKFGNEIIFQMNCKRIIEEGNSYNVIGIGKNITELRNYEEKIKELNVRLLEANRIVSIEKQRSKRQKAILSELNRMKSEFISNISHELRTPLASIIGFSETISSDPNMPEEMRNEFNEIILNEGKRLAKLINEVLDISRLEG